MGIIDLWARSSLSRSLQSQGHNDDPRVLRRTHISSPITRRHDQAERRKYSLNSTVRQKQWTKKGKISACTAQVHLTYLRKSLTLHFQFRLRSADCKGQSYAYLRSGHLQDTPSRPSSHSLRSPLHPPFPDLDTPIPFDKSLD